MGGSSERLCLWGLARPCSLPVSWLHREHPRLSGDTLKMGTPCPGESEARSCWVQGPAIECFKTLV